MATHTSLRSWLAVFGASVALFCCIGFLNAFGVFQDYYLTYLPGKSNSDISWIGSMCIFLTFAVCPFAGVLVDRVGPTIPLVIGSVGTVLAIFMTSLCTEYYQIFLAQAVLLGISSAFVFCSPLGVISRRVPHRRGLVMGLAVGGSSIGGVVWPIMLERLLNNDGVSFGWSLRAVGFTMMPLLAISCLTVVEAPTLPAANMVSTSDSTDENPANAISEKPRKKTSLSIMKDRSFIFLCVGMGMTYLGVFSPAFYVASYTISKGISSNTAFYMLCAYNGASFFGRTIPGLWADRYGHFNICTVATFLAGIIAFCWTAATNLAGIIIWSIAFGFTSGAIMSLQGACAGKVAGHDNQGTAVGLLMGSTAITALVGNPIGGQLVEHYGYLALAMWTGSTLVAGSIFLAIARWHVGTKLLAVH